MNWLPVASDFRSRLQAAALADAHERVATLAALARHRLGYLETIQLDRVLGAAACTPIDGFARVRLALLSACTVDHLAPAIRVAGLRHGLLFDVRLGSYAQYRQEILEPGSSLQQFAPEVVVLSLSAREFIADVPLAADEAEAERAVARAVAEVRALWRAARSRFRATVVQQTMLDVAEPVFGSYDALVPAAPARLIARLNEHLVRAAGEEGVLPLDVARAAARDGIDTWFDVARWLQGKLEIAPAAAPRYGELLARLIAAARGRSRKCLVLDLDNTLWGGAIGDVGVAGIVLGQGSALGEAYLAVQRYAKRLQERGIILAVCSKNDPAIAEAAFRDHPEMVLQRSDFAAFVANWNDKAENLRAIAERLNIGLDSLVFVDDNPAERARIRASLPMVAVPELPDDPALYVRTLADAGYFEAVSFTAEDRNRAESYAADAGREALKSVAQSMDDFLRGLQMTVEYGPARPVDLARVTQLLNKTNQFNTTTRRYAAEEVSALAHDAGALLLQFRLLDRFGDNGLVSVMILRRTSGEADVFEIDNWVMSCRVFGRQLEFEAMTIAVEAARAAGARAIEARFVPTERNGVISHLFETLGFARLPAPADPPGVSRWRLALADYVPRPTFIARRRVA
ncbi:MAG TPA: HAD-IIIC family phosphatase [Burkholderiaceae bacterium]|nr:HAD-IIIC family phosphatase [Burkholderiaceae bacterium]